MTSDPPTVVVWGNCQAPPLAALLREPLAAQGFDVLRVPTVFEATAAEVAFVREAVTRAAVLVTQPIRDEYRHPGCGSEQLAALLPPGGQVVRIPSAVHTGWFPYQANAHDEAGVRVPAPLVEYHDLRLLAAAGRGRSTAEVLEAWPAAASATAVRAAAADSLAELRRRERATDVRISDLVDLPGALFAMNHPANATLAATAARILVHLGLGPHVTVPERQFLGAVRTPVEAHVVAARDDGRVRPDWTVGGRTVTWPDVVTAHLKLYARRPGVVADARHRNAERLDRLGL